MTFPMTRGRSAAFLATAATALCLTTAAHAAEAADGADATGLDEVVVTAEKRETNLQKTPISISAISAEGLSARHIQTIGDLADGAIPSLRVAPFFARSSALTLGIRGIGASGDANQPARDQAVGVYIDGVYLGRAQGLGAALYDIERIEVLKGPQGTLFGRNTMGGAVSIVTKRPSGKFGLNATAGYGNFGAYKAEAHLDLPEFNNVSLKFDALLTKRDGTVRNPTSTEASDYNSYDKRGFHAEAVWKPTDSFLVDYSFDIANDETTPYYVQLLAKGSLALAPLIQLQPERVDQANIGAPLRPSVGNTYGHRLNLEWDATEWLTVKSINAFRRLSQSQYDNAQVLSVFAPNGAFSRYSLANTYQEQFSSELQFIGELPSLKFVGGALYYREKARDNAQSPNTLQWNATGTAYTFLSINTDLVPLDRASHVETDSIGAFGQATWTPPVLGGITHLTLGGRYTHDQKKGSLDVVNGAIPSYVNSAGQTIRGVIPLDDSWSRFDPLVILAVDVAPTINVYGKWSSGYRSGGANSRSLTYRSFAPETVSMFEVGAKTEFWDNRARFNIAAYTGKMKDIQVDFSVLVVGNNRTTLETTNAAEARTKGFEAELTLAPVDGLTLTGSYAYTKVSETTAFNPFTNAQSVVRPLYTPRNSGSVSVDYERPLSFGTLRAHIDANFADGHYTNTSDPTLSDDSFITNARLAISDIQMAESGARLQVSVWARNLFNEQHLFLRNTNASLGTYGIYNDPRTWGVEANVKF